MSMLWTALRKQLASLMVRKQATMSARTAVQSSLIPRPARIMLRLKHGNGQIPAKKMTISSLKEQLDESMNSNEQLLKQGKRLNEQIGKLKEQISELKN